MESTKINFKNIPVQAGIISKILGLDVDSHTCFQELDDLISTDQGVASLVLRVANSAFYNRGNTIATIPFAISLLGYSVVRSLALMAFSRSLFSQTRNPIFRLHIWQHSLLTAIISQNICTELGEKKLTDESFIAGLMHDTGKVLMFNHNSKLYESVFNFDFENNCGSLQAEQKIYGFDHCQIGKQAVTEWKLPERFNDFMGTDLALPSNIKKIDTVMQCLMAANYLVKTAGIGANKVDEQDARKQPLLTLGFDEVLVDRLLKDDYIEGMMEDETYKLCASI